MAASDPGLLEGLFAPFAPATIRRMFSGHAVYREGVVFALAIRGEIFLKCDAESSPAFTAEGLAPFVHATRRGETTVGSSRHKRDGQNHRQSFGSHGAPFHTTVRSHTTTCEPEFNAEIRRTKKGIAERWADRADTRLKVAHGPTVGDR